jgi:hypothetical protein
MAPVARSPLRHLAHLDLVHLHDVAEADRPLDGGGLRRQVNDRVAGDDLDSANGPSVT